MNELATRENGQIEIIEQVLVQGNLAQLTGEQRVIYYDRLCESLGLNKYSRPFEYIVLNGKLTLYARKDCTDQLRKNNAVSIRITTRETISDVYIVTVQAEDRTKRVDESTGAVAIGNLKGDALANAMMKAETKAKRRVTLSLCGLGMLDESEVETVPGAKPFEGEPPPAQRTVPPKDDAPKDPRKAMVADLMKWAGMKPEMWKTVMASVAKAMGVDEPSLEDVRAFYEANKHRDFVEACP